MSSVGEIGDIYLTSGEMRVEWNIQDFFTLSGELGNFYESPVFVFAQSCWCLKIFPMGELKNSTEWIAVYLMRKDLGPSRSIAFTIGIRGCDGIKNIVEQNTEYKFVTANGLGRQKGFLISDLQAQKSKLVPMDILTITCYLKISIKHSTKVSMFTRLWNLSRDIKSILEADCLKDFTFQLSDCKQSANKVILASRSDYFKRMFANDWLENKTGEGNLSHIEGDVFKNVLSYVYTGDVKQMSDENVCQIYKAAHELQLEELIKLCTENMKETMSMDTVCGVLNIANQYEEEELKEHSIQFLAQNAKEILETKTWEEFREENPVLASRILEKVILEKMKRMET